MLAFGVGFIVYYLSRHSGMEMPGQKKETAGSSEVVRSEVERQIIRAVNEIRYGTVHVVIHDGQVLQIERTEKVRVTH